MNNKTDLSNKEETELIQVLKKRFEKNMHRHKGLDWSKIEIKIKTNMEKMWSLNEMERTGGEPDVVSFDSKNDQYIFYDCSTESPKGRRSVCYDRKALESRKKFKPDNNAEDLASELGIEILNEEQYFELQNFENFDTKTSSWIKTPTEIRKLGGALFGDFRFGKLFIYHNGAESYYAARGVRGSLKV